MTYFVMEYVDGVHIDAYCRENKLSIPERLQLFLKVCEAVSTAHKARSFTVTSSLQISWLTRPALLS